MPANLMPSLANAPGMHAVGMDDGCHALPDVVVPNVCSYYGTDTSRSLFLVGDSHALQWQPALMDIAKRHGWRLYMSTKSGCPIPTVTVYQRHVQALDCDAWRQAVFAAIEALRPDVVIATDRNDYHIAGGYEVTSADNQRLWHDGMVTSLIRLKAAAGQVLLLGATPLWSRVIPRCLTHHLKNLSACEDRRRDATSARRSANDRSAADAAGVSYRPTTRLVCPYDPCPVVIDRFLLTGDDDHLLPPFVASLSRGLERLLPTGTSAARRRSGAQDRPHR